MQRIKRNDTLEERKREALDSFVPVRGSGCWLWVGTLDADGYGQACMKHGEHLKAHRIAYEVWVGPIPEGLTIDHVKARGCTARNCVNPSHLEAVTNTENVLRGNSPPAVNARKTHCAKGHPLVARGYGRYCRVCNAARERAAYRDGKRYQRLLAQEAE